MDKNRLNELYVELDHAETEVVLALQHEGADEVKSAVAWLKDVETEITALEITYGTVN